MTLFLTHLRPNIRFIKIATKLGTKCSKRFVSLKSREIRATVPTNCIQNNPYFGYNPLVTDYVKEEKQNSCPILDKFDSNKIYILMNPLLKTSIKQINPILFPDLSTLRGIDINKKRITESETETNAIKEMPAPTKANKMYCDYRIIKDPRSYTHLTIIRRHKMNKHKRKKWRKKMLAFIKKKFLKKNIKKEKLFRAELLSQIKEAEEFDAEKYVKTILETIDNVPKSETRLEKIQKIKDMIRKNRRETNLTSPKFDD